MSIVLAVVVTALEVILAGRSWPPAAAPPERIIASNVVLERAAPTPSPTPRPRPTPPPAAPVVHVTPAPVQRAAPAAVHHAGGVSAAAPRSEHAAVHRAVTRPKATGTSGVAFAPGRGTGAGSGSGTGDDAGSGAGDGSGGNGMGAVNADTPCGDVDFIPDDKPRIVGDVSYETIRATVHYPDGHQDSDDFPYPWVYADYMDADPWSPLNVRKTTPIAAQLPPPGSDTHRYPELIRYILDHTTPAGWTILQPCPH